MSKTIVDIRDSKLKDTDLIRYADKKCIEAIENFKMSYETVKGKNKLQDLTDTVPHKLSITYKQFKLMAALSGELDAKPTGKENFKTSNGYMFEIIVGDKE